MTAPVIDSIPSPVTQPNNALVNASNFDFNASIGTQTNRYRFDNSLNDSVGSLNGTFVGSASLDLTSMDQVAGALNNPDSTSGISLGTGLITSNTSGSFFCRIYATSTGVILGSRINNNNKFEIGISKAPAAGSEYLYVSSRDN